MREMEKIIRWLIRRLVTLYWKKNRFLVYSWGVDENVTLHLISEESYTDRHRFGVHEEQEKEK